MSDNPIFNLQNFGSTDPSAVGAADLLSQQLTAPTYQAPQLEPTPPPMDEQQVKLQAIAELLSALGTIGGAPATVAPIGTARERSRATQQQNRERSNQLKLAESQYVNSLAEAKYSGDLAAQRSLRQMHEKLAMELGVDDDRARLEGFLGEVEADAHARGFGGGKPPTPTDVEKLRGSYTLSPRSLGMSMELARSRAQKGFNAGLEKRRDDEARNLSEQRLHQQQLRSARTEIIRDVSSRTSQGLPALRDLNPLERQQTVQQLVDTYAGDFELSDAELDSLKQSAYGASRNLKAPTPSAIAATAKTAEYRATLEKSLETRLEFEKSVGAGEDINMLMRAELGTYLDDNDPMWRLLKLPSSKLKEMLAALPETKPAEPQR